MTGKPSVTQARYNSLGIEVVPLDAAFGVEVRGVDLWRSPSPRLVSELRALWSEHGIIAFRRQAVSEEELCRFSAEFGDVVPHVRTDWSSKAAREITLVSNMRNALGQGIGGLGAGEIAWHTDQSFVARPATGCLLYAVELPPDNPDTSWANLMLAFEAMPAAMRRAVEGRTAEFSYARRVSGYEAGNEPPAAIAASSSTKLRLSQSAS